MKAKIKVQITYMDPEGPDPDPGGYSHVTVREYDKEEEARAELQKLLKLNPKMRFALLMPATENKNDG